MEVDISNTDVGHIEARDFFASASKPAIRYVPTASSPRKISVEVDGWVFPKGGVDFVWTLASERRKL